MLRAIERAGKVLRMAWYRRPLATAAAVLVAVGATMFVMRTGPSGGTGEPLYAVDESAQGAFRTDPTEFELYARWPD